nr:protoglobin domain-containing protein [Cryobacterium cheniae]
MGSEIPGYSFDAVPPSPISAAELAELMQSVLFTEDDSLAPAQAGDVLPDQVEAILDVWYGFVGANPHLLRYCSKRTLRAMDSRYLPPTLRCSMARIRR